MHAAHAAHAAHARRYSVSMKESLRSGAQQRRGTNVDVNVQRGALPPVPTCDSCCGSGQYAAAAGSSTPQQARASSGGISAGGKVHVVV